MGNMTNLVIIMLTTYLLCGIVAFEISSVDPNSPYLLGSYVFKPSNNYLIQSESDRGLMTYTGADSIQYTQNLSKSGINDLGGNAVVGGSQGSVGATLSFLFPDWIRAGWNWITTTGKMFVNIIGAPYGLIAGTVQNGTLAALLGGFFGMFTLLIVMNWILGKDN